MRISRREVRRGGAGGGTGVRGAILAAVILLAGCATTPSWGPLDRDKLVTASKGYNAMLRWKELDKACLTYAEEPARTGCQERAAALKDLQITDVSTRDIDFRIDGVDATVNVEIEYYLLPSTVVRKIRNSQTWVSVGTGSAGEWKIRSSLPEFPR